MNMQDENSLFGKATKEEDEPLTPMENENPSGGDELEAQRLKMQEREEERQDNRYFNAVRVFVGCLIFLGVVYLVDVIASAILTNEMSKITNAVIETIKTLLFSLSGYLFARTEKK